MPLPCLYLPSADMYPPIDILSFLHPASQPFIHVPFSVTYICIHASIWASMEHPSINTCSYMH